MTKEAVMVGGLGGSMRPTSAVRVALALLLLLGLSAEAAPKRQITYYLSTAKKDAAGFQAPDYQDRMDSIYDLRLRLVKERDIQLVPLRQGEGADLIIEVLGRHEGAQDEDIRWVHVRVTAGSYVLAIDGRNDDGEWGTAAGDAAQQIRAWIYSNYERLVRQRPERPKLVPVPPPPPPKVEK